LLSRTLALAIAIVLVTVALPQSSIAQNHGAPFAAAGKDRRPMGDGPIRGNRNLDCSSPVLTLEVTAPLVHTFSDSTFGDSNVDAYGCRPDLAETGPEHVIELTVVDDVILDIWLSGGGPDHDIILLSDCHPDSCIIQGNSQISATLEQGRTYYLVVDGYQFENEPGGAAGRYNLNFEGRHLGIPEEICDSSDIGVPLDPIELQIYEDEVIMVPASVLNLYEAVNRVSIYDCSPITVQGGEKWFEVTVAAADTAHADGDWDSGEYPWDRYQDLEITVSTDVISLDLTLWVFDGCGPEAECLAYVDDNSGGGLESIIFENLEMESQSFYLAVDCIIPVADEDEGLFLLDITATTPVETRSLSNMRDLFK